MNQQQTPCACAVIYAGDTAEMVLAIQERPGRFPIVITQTEAPTIAWLAHDGATEHIRLEGPRAMSDHRNLREELARGELLVAEVSDPTAVNLDLARYHLVAGPKKPAVERAQ